jgi:hypothetical protein
MREFIGAVFVMSAPLIEIYAGNKLYKSVA